MTLYQRVVLGGVIGGIVGLVIWAMQAGSATIVYLPVVIVQ